MQKYLTVGLMISLSYGALAQQSVIDSSKYPRLKTFTAQQDQAQMMQQLGIKTVRPGPSGNESAPNHANYDEALANPCPQLPDVLTTRNGKKVTTPDQWWNQRRPEIIEDFEKGDVWSGPQKYA